MFVYFFFSSLLLIVYSGLFCVVWFLLLRVFVLRWRGDLAELRALQEQISAEQMQLHRGETFKCFVSGKGKLGDNYVAARTDGNLIIEFEGDDSLIGSFQNVKVIEPLTYVLRGELERN